MIREYHVIIVPLGGEGSWQAVVGAEDHDYAEALRAALEVAEKQQDSQEC